MTVETVYTMAEYEIGWTRKNVSRPRAMRCLSCGMEVPDTLASAMIHHEKVRKHDDSPPLSICDRALMSQGKRVVL